MLRIGLFGAIDPEGEVDDVETVERLLDVVVRGGCWLGVRLVTENIAPLCKLVADADDEPS